MRRFGEIRLLEHARLGHGPLWLDYYATALAPLCQRLSVCYPKLPAYASLNEVSKAWSVDGTDVQLEPIPLEGRSALAETDALERACAPGADLTLITFLDHLMRQRIRLPRALAAGRPEIWGVWFNPALPDVRGVRTLQRWLSSEARKRHRAQRVLQNPPDWLDGAFFLDASLAERVARVRSRIIPDCWPTRPRHSQREARDALGLATEKKLFLHFGEAHPRKGLADVVDVWTRLPGEAVLLRAGTLDDARPPGLGALERAGRAIVHDREIPEAQVDLYFRAADWLLLPYREHEGSSGILSAAAAAQRPVAASDYGVVGRRVREAKLGILYEHASVDALADALARAIATPISDFTRALDAYADDQSLRSLYAALRATWPADSEERKDP